MVRKSTSSNVKIGVQLPTREKYLAFGRITRRKIVDVADMAIDALFKSEGLEIPVIAPETAQPSRRHRRAE